ncbi:MAG: HEAT repeat domain-containing protein [Desulfobacterales bacterium]
MTDPPEIQTLISALRSEDKWVRWGAAVALVEIGPEAKAAVPDLLRVFKNKNELEFVRHQAVEALEEIGPEAFPGGRETLFLC